MSDRADLRRVTLVVNPTAGRGRARQVLPQVTQLLRSGLADGAVQIVVTNSPAHAEQACRDAVADSDALLVLGGDGTAHAGVNACARTGVPLGVLPAGTGNDLCRGLGLPLRLTDAVAGVLRGRTRPADLALVTPAASVEAAAGPGLGIAGPPGNPHGGGGGSHNAEPPADQVGDGERWVGCVVSTGFDSRVARRAAASRLIGPIAYPLAALAELRTFDPLRYRLLVAGVPRELDAMAIFVCNTEFFGGGMRAAPGADPGDGLLDVTIIHPVSRATLLRLLPTLYSGGFVRHPATERFRTAELIVDGDGLIGSGDGESLGDVPLRVRAVRHALRVLG